MPCARTKKDGFQLLPAYHMTECAAAATDMCTKDLRVSKKRKTSRNGGVSCLTLPLSEYPRGGSLIVNQASSATSRPGAPTITNVQRHPYQSFEWPATTLPIAVPNGTAIAYTASAVARFEPAK